MLWKYTRRIYWPISRHQFGQGKDDVLAEKETQFWVAGRVPFLYIAFPPPVHPYTMSNSAGDSSSEDFDTTQSDRSHDGDQSEVATEFHPIARTWTPEQTKVLLARVDDWKASKYAKAQRLVIQGAVGDLLKLPNAPPIDGLRIASETILRYIYVINAHLVYALEC